MLNACVVRFDVMRNLKIFWKLNKALVSNSFIRILEMVQK